MPQGRITLAFRKRRLKGVNIRHLYHQFTFIAMRNSNHTDSPIVLFIYSNIFSAPYDLSSVGVPRNPKTNKHLQISRVCVHAYVRVWQCNVYSLLPAWVHVCMCVRVCQIVWLFTYSVEYTIMHLLQRPMALIVCSKAVIKLHGALDKEL